MINLMRRMCLYKVGVRGVKKVFQHLLSSSTSDVAQCVLASVSFLGIGLPVDERNAVVQLTGGLEQLRFQLEADMQSMSWLEGTALIPSQTLTLCTIHTLYSTCIHIKTRYTPHKN